MESLKIYLDNNATTLIDKEVLKIISNEYFPENPSSTHFFGKKAKKKLLDSKNIISNFLKIKNNNIIFTSSGTEAVNIAIRSILNNKKPTHIIATDIDHACVYNTLKYLENFHEVTYINTGKDGVLTKERIEGSIKENTKLIVLSAVNSETGIKADLEKIATLAKENNIYLAVDGVALLGKELFTIPDGVTTMAFSSHKLHGPKGVGMCYLKENIPFTPLLFGAHQENGKRPGTENLSGIMGFAKAIDLLNHYLPNATNHMLKLREHFEETLKRELKDIISINGRGLRICNTSNICFKGIDGESLLISLDRQGILASLGSACSSGSLEPSRTLLNMGIDPKDAMSSVRFSFCRNTTFEEVEKALRVIVSTVSNF